MIIRKQILFFACAVIFVSGCVLGVHGAHAATSPTIHFETQYTNVQPNSEIEIGIFLDSEVEVNAFDIRLSFTSDLLTYQGFDETKSLVDIWETKPTLSNAHELVLSGGLFRPFKGAHGELVRLKFTAREVGSSNITFLRGNVFLADGKGTPVNILAEPLIVRISSRGEFVSSSPVRDTSPPELIAKVVQAPLDKSNILVFSSKDNESGINRAEFRTLKWFAWSAWQPAENPIRIPEGIMVFELKVMNRAGNETISRILMWPEIITDGVIVLFIVITATAIYIWFYNKKKVVVR